MSTSTSSSSNTYLALIGKGEMAVPLMGASIEATPNGTVVRDSEGNTVAVVPNGIIVVCKDYMGEAPRIAPIFRSV